MGAKEKIISLLKNRPPTSIDDTNVLFHFRKMVGLP
jgi:hypothetical protein